MHVYFANYTAWSSKAKSFLLHESHREEFSVTIGVEHHLAGDSLKAARKLTYKAGWRSFVNPAVQTSKKGFSGGEWILVKRSVSVAHDRYHPQEAHGWASCTLRVKGFDFLLVSLYLESGQDPFSDTNAAKLDNLGRFLKVVSLPYMVVGDWNCTPEQLAETSWLNFVKGSVVAPNNVDYTCRQGQGSLIDYVVCSTALRCMIKVEADLNGPWTPPLWAAYHCQCRFRNKRFESA
jgi:hypothetical protein